MNFERGQDPKSAMDIGMNRKKGDKFQELKIGDRVIYVPTHASGDINHKDCEYGIVKSKNDTYVFVNYVKNGIPQMIAESTRPEDLYLDAKAI